MSNQTISIKRTVSDIFIPIEDQLGKSVDKDEVLKRIQHIKEEAYQKGYKAGHKDASEEKTKEYTEKLNKLNEQVTQFMENIPPEIRKVLKDLEKEVVKLSFSIAKKIIKKEVENKEHIINLVTGLLDDMSERTELNLKMNPQDVASLRSEGLEMKIASEVKELKIIEDYEMPRGGCILESNLGWLDATIDSQIAEIEKSLLTFETKESTENGKQEETSEEEIKTEEDIEQNNLAEPEVEVEVEKVSAEEELKEFPSGEIQETTAEETNEPSVGGIEETNEEQTTEPSIDEVEEIPEEKQNDASKNKIEETKEEDDNTLNKNDDSSPL